MHFIFWILTMAIALIFLGVGLILHALMALKLEKANHKIPASRFEFSPSDLQKDWEQFLPCLFHEMRNYSCSLKGNALLLRREPLSESMLIPLNRLERTTEKIDSISRDFLDAASISKVINPKPLDIVDLVQGCIDDHFYDCNQSFHIETGGEIPTITGDFLKLERIFLNLFRNAKEAGAKNIWVRFNVQPQGLRITVEDDGSGVTDAQVGKMFNPLYTTKKERGGTGLGLYMVKAIVESHRGSIVAVSKNGSGRGESGLLFNLVLPLPRNPKNRILNWSSLVNSRI